MLNLARNGYTADAVKTALHAPNRTMKFRYEILDTTGALKRRSSSIVGGSVKYGALDEIKRTAQRRDRLPERSHQAVRVHSHVRRWIRGVSARRVSLGVFEPEGGRVQHGHA
jgi:hypothetical protein